MDTRMLEASSFKCDVDVAKSAGAATEHDRADTRVARPLASYVPKPTDAVKIVCVNVHVIQNGDGLGNYQATDMPRLRQILDWTNANFMSVDHPSTVPSPVPQLIPDSRIRFRLNSLEFYRDEALYQVDHQPTLQLAALARNPTTLSQLNVYLPAAKPIPNAASGWATWPGTTQPDFDSWVVMRVSYRDRSDPNWEHSDWGLAGLLAHELGHTLDLAHTYLGGGADPLSNTSHPDFLVDVFGDPSTCPHDVNWAAPLGVVPWGPKVTNNIVGGSGHGSRWISGLQAAMMHRSLAHHSVRRYLATGCHDCVSCVAFTVRGTGHVSEGPDVPLTYQTVDVNETWGWSGQRFIAPVGGIYHFDVSFVKDAYYHGATQEDVRVSLNRNNTSVGRAWSGEGAGRRGTGCLSVNTRLKAGDVVATTVGSDHGLKRHLPEYQFAGHLVCGCC